MEGVELRDLRRAIGLKAYRLAEQLDISSATLSRYENGKAPVPKAIEYAARYLCEPKFIASSAGDRLVAALKEALDDPVEPNRHP